MFSHRGQMQQLRLPKPFDVSRVCYFSKAAVIHRSEPLVQCVLERRLLDGAVYNVSSKGHDTIPTKCQTQ